MCILLQSVHINGSLVLPHKWVRRETGVRVIVYVCRFLSITRPLHTWLWKISKLNIDNIDICRSTRLTHFHHSSGIRRGTNIFVSTVVTLHIMGARAHIVNANTSIQHAHEPYTNTTCIIFATLHWNDICFIDQYQCKSHVCVCI